MHNMHIYIYMCILMPVSSEVLHQRIRPCREGGAQVGGEAGSPENSNDDDDDNSNTTTTTTTNNNNDNNHNDNDNDNDNEQYIYIYIYLCTYIQQ